MILGGSAEIASDPSLKGLHEKVGALPAGDVPSAWYASVDPRVLAAYDEYLAVHKQWTDRLAELLRISGLDPSTQYSTLSGHYLAGLIVPTGTTRRWWREGDDGLFVPRKRTKEEKASEVNALWEQLRVIPHPADNLPGMPSTLWLDSAVSIPVVRKPGDAVLVFLANDPDSATVPFEVGQEWARLKMSTYLLLQERQQAAAHD